MGMGNEVIPLIVAAVSVGLLVFFLWGVKAALSSRHLEEKCPWLRKKRKR